MKAKKPIVGLDPSLASFGFASITKNGTELASIKTRKTGDGLVDRMDRIELLVDQVFKRCQAVRPKMIAIEGYAFGSRNSRSMTALAELGGAIRRDLVSHFPVIEITPSEVKKFATGRGNADKASIRLSIFKRWEIEAEDDDQADAFVLAKMAEAVIDWKPFGELAGYQKKIIEAIQSRRANSAAANL